MPDRSHGGSIVANLILVDTEPGARFRLDAVSCLLSDYPKTRIGFGVDA